MLRSQKLEIKSVEILYRFRFPGQVGGLIMPPSG